MVANVPDGFQPIREFYDREYYFDYHASELPWHTKRVASRLGDVQGHAVLDVACGAGEWLQYLQLRGARVAGIDLSQRAIEQCAKRISGGEFVCGVAEDLPFETGRFDLVTCMGSLEHFLDKPRALAEMRRVAKPDARFLILVPNADFLTRRLGFYRGTQQVKAREDVLDLDTWARLFDSAGLKVLSRWRDLHPLNWHWITRGSAWTWPVRAAQAIALAAWPVSWQYQVYHYCRVNE